MPGLGYHGDAGALSTQARCQRHTTTHSQDSAMGLLKGCLVPTVPTAECRLGHVLRMDQDTHTVRTQTVCTRQDPCQVHCYLSESGGTAHYLNSTGDILLPSCTAFRLHSIHQTTQHYKNNPAFPFAASQPPSLCLAYRAFLTYVSTPSPRPALRPSSLSPPPLSLSRCGHLPPGWLAPSHGKRAPCVDRVRAQNRRRSECACAEAWVRECSTQTEQRALTNTRARQDPALGTRLSLNSSFSSCAGIHCRVQVPSS